MHSAVLPEVVISGLEGSGLTVIVVGSETGLLHPMASVTMSVMLTEVLMGIAAVLPPFDHAYALKPVGPARVTIFPEQKAVGPDGDINGLSGDGLSVTRVGSETGLRHPLESVTCTV